MDITEKVGNMIADDFKAIALAMTGGVAGCPASHLKLVNRSEAHQLAISYSSRGDGAWPWAEGSVCHEDHIWRAYMDLEAAGLIQRSGAVVKGDDLIERINFQATETGMAVAQQHRAIQDHIFKIQERAAAMIEQHRQKLINGETT